jgi:predicted nucleotidyltransferase
MSTLNLSGRIDPGSVAIYAAIDSVAGELNIPYVVIGAAARDLVLHYGYGARLRRATRDIDIGIQVPNWNAFGNLLDRLIASGFKETKSAHRFAYQGMSLDIVPCGSIQDGDANIAWPPGGDVVMNVLGFQEAIDNAMSVIIREKPKLEIAVAPPPALSLLKLISWSEREADLKSKDAADLRFLLETYYEMPEVNDSIYEQAHAGLMEEYDWNIVAGSAFILGLNASKMASERTRKYLAEIQNNRIKKRPYEMLVEDMCTDIEEEYKRNQMLLAAYFRGFDK